MDTKHEESGFKCNVRLIDSVKQGVVCSGTERSGYEEWSCLPFSPHLSPKGGRYRLCKCLRLSRSN